MTFSPKRVVFTAKQQVSLETFDPGPLPEDAVLVQTQLSLMSTGTENIFFNRDFDAGTNFENWAKYPFHPGYAAVGQVIEVGSKVKSLALGDRVALRKGHCSHAVAQESECVKIPDKIALEEAVWFAIAKITFHGALAGKYRLGDRILVIGAGPIGQMSVRWAKASGASAIVVVDMAKSRLEIANSGGATAVINRPINEAREDILNALDGSLPDTVVDTTGNATVFSYALQLCRDQGRVLVLGDTGQPSSQKLTQDVVVRGLTVVGAHDSHITPKWNGTTIPLFFFKLVKDQRISMAGLNSHIFKPSDCASAYEIANRDRANTLGILFDWQND